jgi:FeS assembly SUF system protein
MEKVAPSMSTRDQIIEQIKTVYDPEIPVNIYDLGLIYEVTVEDAKAHILMTLTAPACPAAEILPEEVSQKAGEVNGIEDVEVELTFDPPWDKEMMSEEAQLELGFL